MRINFPPYSIKFRHARESGHPVSYFYKKETKRAQCESIELTSTRLLPPQQAGSRSLRELGRNDGA